MIYNWVSTREKSVRVFAKNEGADQPAHLRRLISTFVFRLLESIISILATSENSTFLLVSVAEQAGLKLTLSETPKSGFLELRPSLIWSTLKSILGIFSPRPAQLIKSRTPPAMTSSNDRHKIYLKPLKTQLV